jgi:hypothetical protein
MHTVDFFRKDVVDNYFEFERTIYLEYRKMADEKLQKEIQSVLKSDFFLGMLKIVAGRCGYKFKEYRKITVILGSGTKIEIASPVFIKSKSEERKKGRQKKRKAVTKHFAIEHMGFIERKSPGLVSLCSQAAILCPSFDVAVKFLNNQNININHSFLQKLTYTLADMAMRNRTTVALDSRIKEKGLHILICIDGGRIRERVKKRGARNKGLKRQGFTTDWKEPKLFTVHLVDENGRVDRSFKPLYDGTLENADGMFDLLEKYLKNFNIEDSKRVTFCCDGGSWIWNRIPELAIKLGIENYSEVLDYTHAKQNLRGVLDIVLASKGITQKDYEKTYTKLKNLLWEGRVSEIRSFVCNKLKNKRGKKKAVNKLDNYFGESRKFQYSKFKEKGIPIGSGTVESAIRRVLNLRIKGPGVFWKKENAERMIFLRSQLLSDRWNIMMENINLFRRKDLKIQELEEFKNAA